MEYKVRVWMEEVTGEPIPEPDEELMKTVIQRDRRESPWLEFYTAIRDGSYLCKLVEYVHCSGANNVYSVEYSIL